ncbi:MAG: VCBS repeat-containing protein [Flavobacteriales bacterium]|nr:VCBS repeat-containing protein [Flavobacteriales bacterium]
MKPYAPPLPLLHFFHLVLMLSATTMWQAAWGQCGELTYLSPKFANLKAAVSGDLDGDGSQDVLSVAIVGQQSLFLRSLNNGAGYFTIPDTLFTTGPITQLLLEDILGDGTADVIYSSETGLWVTYLSSMGEVDSISHVHNATNLSLVAVVDVDADGDNDIVTSMGENAGVFTITAWDSSH